MKLEINLKLKIKYDKKAQQHETSCEQKKLYILLNQLNFIILYSYSIFPDKVHLVYKNYGLSKRANNVRDKIGTIQYLYYFIRVF